MLVCREIYNLELKFGTSNSNRVLAMLPGDLSLQSPYIAQVTTVLPGCQHQCSVFQIFQNSSNLTGLGGCLENHLGTTSPPAPLLAQAGQ